jgi:hypothetical protein
MMQDLGDLLGVAAENVDAAVITPTYYGIGLFCESPFLHKPSSGWHVEGPQRRSSSYVVQIEALS